MTWPAVASACRGHYRTNGVHNKPLPHDKRPCPQRVSRAAPEPTWTCDQLPPRAVGTLRALRAAASPARLVIPAACSSRTIGKTLPANWSAAALTAALASTAAAVGLGLPRRTPRALAA